jgi:protein SCO1/2
MRPGVFAQPNQALCVRNLQVSVIFHSMSVPSNNSGHLPRQPRWMIRCTGAVLWLLMIPALWISWHSRIAKSQETNAQAGRTTSNGDVVVDKVPDTRAGVPLAVGELPPFELTAHTGQQVTRDDLLGHPWVAGFVFTRCTMTCPEISLQFRRLQDALPPDNPAKLISITVDPTYDTPELLARFAENFGADPDRWLFLTGDQKDVYRLTTVNFGMFARELFGKDRKPGFEVAHTNRVVLVNSEGVPVRSFLAVGPTADTEMLALRRILEGKRPFPDVPVPAAEEPDESGADMSGQAGDSTVGQTTVDTKQLADPEQSPAWLTSLPMVNAGLNTLAAVLLLFGLGLIKSGRKTLHKTCMLTAFFVSIAFLGCYLTHKTGLWHYTGVPSRQFSGTGTMKVIYLAILVPHIILAALVPFLASITIYRGFKQQWERHRWWAKITFPIWLYVSVTGLIIYLMLYRWPAAASV